MSKPAHFKVDPKLAALLGENYRSSEEALRELVDNAWDAESAAVDVSLPTPLSKDPIVIADDGSGMTERELREEYLFVASDRRSRKGERTAGLKRLVKGRKGIGKFAGLMVANTMIVESCAKGQKSRLTISRPELLSAVGSRDLERVDLPITSETCPETEHGTRIVLSELSQNLEFPSSEKLKQILVLEYDRKAAFRVRVNGEPLSIDDIPGETIDVAGSLPLAGSVRLRCTITEGKPLKHSGIAIRVGGKIVGRPTTLGLEDDETIPSKLLRRIYGEIEADGLSDDVTADWGAIIDNSLGLGEVRKWAANQLGTNLKRVFKNEVNLQKARLEKELRASLDKLPENRRKAAERAVQKVFQRFYGESEERIRVVVGLLLEAFEDDAYWLVLRSIDDAAREDVGRLAGILDEFGIVDVAVVAGQCKGRLGFLDELEALIRNPATLEADVHKAIESNLWVLGSSFATIASNKTLKRLIQDWQAKKFGGPDGTRRPDLFLAQDIRNRHLLIEFKRPDHDITRTDEKQAEEYRDELATYTQRTIDILLLGKGRAPSVSDRYGKDKLEVLSYRDVLSTARSELKWLLNQLGADASKL